jgi:hypothetical protein
MFYMHMLPSCFLRENSNLSSEELKERACRCNLHCFATRRDRRWRIILHCWRHYPQGQGMQEACTLRLLQVAVHVAAELPMIALLNLLNGILIRPRLVGRGGCRTFSCTKLLTQYQHGELGALIIIWCCNLIMQLVIDVSITSWKPGMVRDFKIPYISEITITNYSK